MRFQPNSDRVLVLPDDPSDRTESGLYKVTNREPDDPVGATVVAVGPGKIDSPSTRVSMDDSGHEVLMVPPMFGPGDRVLVDPIGGLKLTIDGKKHRILRQEEILGWLVEDVPA